MSKIIRFLKSVKREAVKEFGFNWPKSSLVNIPVAPENMSLKGSLLGQTVFLLATGSSIRDEDLSQLIGHTCISVSNFYLHSDFSRLKPVYHFVPNAFSPLTDDGIADWFENMHQGLGDTTIILGDLQKQVVEERQLFKGRKKYFLPLQLPAHELLYTEEIDICQKLPNVQSVPIMCLMAAMEMGAARVCMLGVDHDSLFRGKYEHFYERKDQKMKDPNVSDDGRPLEPLQQVFESHTLLWNQYIAINRMAERRGMEILNLSKKSYLDVFPRSSIREVIARTNPSPATVLEKKEVGCSI